MVLKNCPKIATILGTLYKRQLRGPLMRANVSPKRSYSSETGGEDTEAGMWWKACSNRIMPVGGNRRYWVYRDLIDFKEKN